MKISSALLILATPLLAIIDPQPPVIPPAPPLDRWTATVTAVHDGDTYTVEPSAYFFGTRLGGTYHIRLSDVNCPELDAPDPEPGIAAGNYARTRLLGHTVQIRSVKQDHFGRWLSPVSIDGVDFGAELVGKSMAVPYMVGK